MPTKDIGGGFQMFDAGSAVDDSSQLMKLKFAQEDQHRQNALAGLQAEKANLDIQKQGIELAKSRADLGQNALAIYASGDTKRANELWQQHVNPNEILIPHPSKAKQAQRVFLIKDALTGDTREFDFMTETRMREQIQTRAKIAFELARANIDDTKGRDKYMTENALKLVENGVATNLQEGLGIMSDALSFARDMNRGTRKQDFPGVQNGPKQISRDRPSDSTAMNVLNKGTLFASTELTPDQIASRMESQMQLEAAQKFGSDNLTRPLRKVERIPDKERGELTSLLDTNKRIGSDITSRVMKVYENNVLQRPNILGSKIQDVLNTPGLNLGKDDVLALKVATEKNFWDALFLQSGAAFTERELIERKKLYPTSSDTVGQILTKSSVLMALNSAKAANTFNVLDANRYDTGGMRKLFQGQNWQLAKDEDGVRSGAQIFLNAIDPSIDRNGPVFNDIYNALPPYMQPAVREEMRRQGQVSSKIWNDEFNSIRRK